MKCRNNTWIMLISLIIFPFLSVSQSKQIDFSYENNLSRYAKVWGLLKYYHPEIAKGTIDWDSVLVNNIPHLKTTDSKEKFNSEIIKLFNIAGDVNIYDTLIPANPDSVKRYPDFDWIQDSIYFSVPMIKKMEFIIDNKAPFDNYYVQVVDGIGCTSYENEKAYEDMVFPAEEYRLLALFRYWNVINYFFPYKHLMDRGWNEVLFEYIPAFINVKNPDEYNLLISELTTNINDSHALTTTKFFIGYLGDNFLPFSVEFIEGKTVISEVYEVSDLGHENIYVGDIIIEINGEQISEYRDKLYKLVAASNEAVKQYFVSVFMSRINAKKIGLTINRNDSLYRFSLSSMSYDDMYLYSIQYHSNVEVLKWVASEIAYIRMAYLHRNMVDSIMSLAINSKAIVFDLREYPRNTLYRISEYLNPYKSSFSLTYKPDINYPGLFRYKRVIESGPAEYNENNYKGIVVILVNEKTHSHGEFTCMALQTAPDAITIGCQTSGSDGNVSEIVLPGNIKTCFSGIGIAYPSGEETQRIGIVPDIKVSLTIDGIKHGKDEILEAALDYIKYRNTQEKLK